MNLKKTKLIGLTLIMALALMFIFVPSQVKAGTSMSSSTNVTFGKSYTSSWTTTTDNLSYYNRVTIPSKGILKMTFTKPSDYYGDYGRLHVYVCDKNGNIMWDTASYYSRSNSSSKYTFNIGLAKGTYYVVVSPGFEVLSGTIKTTYNFTFSSNNNIEIESNETKAKATGLSLGKTYQGYFGNDEGNFGVNDYYKVSLTKNNKYRINIGNFGSIANTNTLVYLHTPSGGIQSIKSNFAKTDSSGNKYYEFTAKETGRYYIQFTNYYGAQFSYKLSVAERSKGIANAQITFSSSSYAYTGSNVIPKITVKYDGKTLKNGTDYTLSYSNNKNIGTATVKITGKGKYSGSVTKKFKIALSQIKGVSASSQTTSAITLRWNKVSGVDGYQVDMATSKNGTYKRVGAPNSSTRNYLTKSNLTPGKTYYFKVRSYKTINGKKYYGAYSTIFSTSTKPNTSVISTVTSTSKKATITWKKDASVSGYEVYMATSKTGTYSKIVAPARNTTVSYTKSNLISGKTYYFKVRSYKLVDGKKIYSNFSTVKYVKVK